MSGTSRRESPVAARGSTVEQVPDQEPALLDGVRSASVLWTRPSTGEQKRIRFWSVIASGASILLLCTDETGAFRAYRAEECRAVEP